MKSKSKSVLTLFLSMAILLGMVISFPGTALAADVDYTDIDYSTAIAIGTPVTGQIGDAETLDYTYIEDDLFFDKGYTITLQKDHAYSFTVEWTNIEYVSGSESYNEFYILDGGTLTGDDYGDVRFYDYSYFYTGYESQNCTYVYTAVEDGDIRLLTGLYEKAITSLNYSIRVNEVDSVNPTWTQEISSDDSVIYSMAAGPDGTLYYTDVLLSESPGFELIAVTANGTEKWRKEIPAYMEEGNFGNLLVGDDGTVYLSCFSYEDPNSPPQGRMMAFDSEGNELWNNVMEVYGIPAFVIGQMALSADGVLIASALRDDDDDAYSLAIAIDAETGEMLWALDKSENFISFDVRNSWCGPAIFEDIVYLAAAEYDTYGGWVYIVDIPTGEIIERVYIDDCCGPLDSSFAIGPDGTLYCVGDGDIEYEGEDCYVPVWAIAPDGSVRWVVESGLDDTDRFILTADGENLYIGAEEQLLIIDMENGEKLNQIDMAEEIYAILLTNNGIGVQLENGMFAKYDEDGTLQSLVYLPVWEGDLLPILTDDGKLYVRDENGISKYDDIGTPIKNGWAMVGGNAGRMNRFVAYTEYTIDFESGGGTEITSVSVESGTAVAKPADPQRSGYTFEGWYTDSSFTTEYDFNAPLTANVTLYANWVSIPTTTAIPTTTTTAATTSTISSTAPNSEDVPKTGYSTNSIFLVMLAFSSILGVGAFVSLKKKKNEE
ncbi:MAG: InlB B-repeat-containing protein [Eubacteriales bacterium]|nr:InlB B-repeat-containing protein [Desulfitobacteriaceae bacterium]MDD4495820.1 InlB B-repeat-containing protein [Eubacteriales bacterium]